MSDIETAIAAQAMLNSKHSIIARLEAENQQLRESNASMKRTMEDVLAEIRRLKQRNGWT